MKAKIIYIVSFVAAFLLVTGGIIYLNSEYRNIFHFDFTPEIHKTNKTDKTKGKISNNVEVADLKNYFQNEFKHEIFDSLKVLFSSKKTDTVYAKNSKNKSLVDSLKHLEEALRKSDAALKKQDIAAADSVNKTKAKSDSAYNAWLKQTARLYQSMDPARAAKIIQSYSDNVARDIIYSMRQQQAAEILSQFSPETANRITRAK